VNGAFNEDVVREGAMSEAVALIQILRDRGYEDNVAIALGLAHVRLNHRRLEAGSL